MAVRRPERRIPSGLIAGDLGQASGPAAAPSGGTYTLVSYLTSPVVVSTRLDYVLFAEGGAAADQYQWTVTDVAAGTALASRVTEDGVFDWTAAATGDVTVSVVIEVAGTVVATVSLDQSITARDPTVETDAAAGAASGSGLDFEPVREMVNDLKTYMTTAVAGTGPNGIPLQMLAAVLYTEIYNRPKDGTATAAVKRAAGDEDEIRDVELAMMAEIYDDSWDTRRWIYAPKSLGVGQIAQTSAAMALGLITWRDQNPRARSRTRELILKDYRNLTNDVRTDLFNRLRFPKTNVAVAATILATLKNRAHRWPSLTADAMLTTSGPLEIVTTEYNMGGTTTPAASATPSSYGTRAAMLLSGGFPADLRKYFP